MLLNFNFYQSVDKGKSTGSLLIDTDFLIGPIIIKIWPDDAVNPYITKYRIILRHNSPNLMGKDVLLQNTLYSFIMEGYVRGPLQHDELKTLFVFLNSIHREEFGMLNDYDTLENIDLAAFTFVKYMIHIKHTLKSPTAKVEDILELDAEIEKNDRLYE